MPTTSMEELVQRIRARYQNVKARVTDKKIISASFLKICQDEFNSWGEYFGYDTFSMFKRDVSIIRARLEKGDKRSKSINTKPSLSPKINQASFHFK